ncbi:MAG TPA: hypothetical protein VJN18_32515 [Polyangiaceae bacterium]|nr:hypothetical protein [Polyangiaceae bacterium]
MSLIAFVTDQHFDGHNDLEETVRVHNWIADDARARGCEATLLGGDALEKRSIPSDRNALGAWLLRLAEFGPVVGDYGNHEIEGDLDLYNDLGGKHPITFYSQPAVHFLPELQLAIGCVPWPHLGALLARLDGVSAEQAQNAARDLLRTIILGLGAEMDRQPFARIGLAHLMLSGATTDHDQPVRGSELVLSGADLAPMRAGIWLLGHIHAQQVLKIGDVEGVYGGGTEHCNWGEPGQKGYTIVRTDGPRIVGYERIPTPVAPMVLAQGVFADGSLSNSYAHRDVAGADVRFRFHCPIDQRESAKAAAEAIKADLLARGALSVTLEDLVDAETRARAPDVALAKGHREKLEAHWASVGFDPGPRRAALLAKADQLHEATHEA